MTILANDWGTTLASKDAALKKAAKEVRSTAGGLLLKFKKDGDEIHVHGKTKHEAYDRAQEVLNEQKPKYTAPDDY